MERITQQLVKIIGMNKNLKNCRFVMYDKLEASTTSDQFGDVIALREFSNIVVHPFKFPFSGIAKIKEAVRIQARPLLGDAAAEVSIVPQFAEGEKKSSSGCAYLLFDDSAQNESARASHNVSVWPAPLAAAGQVQGSGLILFLGDENVSSMLIEDWIPRYYSVTPREGCDIGSLAESAKSLAEASGITVQRVFEVDLSEHGDDELQRWGMDTLEKCPSLATLDLSNRGADRLEMREKLVSVILRTGRLLAAVGAIVLLIVGGLLYVQSSAQEKSTNASGDIYLESFGESSRQPLSSARAKLRGLTGDGGGEIVLIEMIKSLASAWQQLGSNGSIVLEDMRYGQENVDITGTSENNETIQQLRTILENDGYSPRIDNIQHIPNGSLRFNMAINRGSRP